VPAAAVIPAPIAYIKVVAVKKFVVECLGPTAVDLVSVLAGRRPSLQGSARRASVVSVPPCINYCEQIRVFKAGRTA
jgi:hypothetical protein